MSKPDVRTQLRRTIAADRPLTAVDRLLEVTRQTGLGDVEQDAIALRARLLHLADQRGRGTQDYDDLIRTRNKILEDLLGLIGRVPETVNETLQEGGAAGKSMVGEHKIRRRVFTILIVGKLLVIAFLYLMWITGSNVSRAEFFTLLGILLPMFIVHLQLIFRRNVAERYNFSITERRVTRSFARTAVGLSIAYPIILLVLLRLLAPGDIARAEFNTLLGMVEGSVGGFLGVIVAALTKERPR